ATSMGRPASIVTSSISTRTRRPSRSRPNRSPPAPGAWWRMRDEARAAMAGFADNMDALKRNFLLRGFFNRRGYFDLSQISPTDYRNGKLTADNKRQPVRVWLSSAVLFETDPDTKTERLTDDRKARLDSAIAPFLDRITNCIVIIEGYSQLPTIEQQFVQSRARATGRARVPHRPIPPRSASHGRHA